MTQYNLWDGRRDGATFDPDIDEVRLNRQHKRVLRVMADGFWHTLHEISQATADPEASVSARLRDFRKLRFGGFTVERQRVKGAGTWQYRVLGTIPLGLLDEAGKQEARS